MTDSVAGTSNVSSTLLINLASFPASPANALLCLPSFFVSDSELSLSLLLTFVLSFLSSSLQFFNCVLIVGRLTKKF